MSAPATTLSKDISLLFLSCLGSDVIQLPREVDRFTLLARYFPPQQSCSKELQPGHLPNQPLLSSHILTKIICLFSGHINSSLQISYTKYYSYADPKIDSKQLNYNNRQPHFYYDLILVYKKVRKHPIYRSFSDK